MSIPLRGNITPLNSFLVLLRVYDTGRPSGELTSSGNRPNLVQSLGTRTHLCQQATYIPIRKCVLSYLIQSQRDILISQV